MFSDMVPVLVWGVVLSVVVIVAAAMTENRGWHAIRVFMGLTSREQSIDVYADVPRPDITWDLLGELVDPEMEEPLLDAALLSSQARAAATRAVPGGAPAVSFQQVQPRALPVSVAPTRREPIFANR